MKRVLVVGGGVIGLSVAYHVAGRGHEVTVLDRDKEAAQGCSHGNAGMVVPSHFIPLAAPGMVALGLRWMWNPESPFHIRPRLDWELLDWGVRFWRAATRSRVARAAPVLRDLSLESRRLFLEMAAATDNRFGLVEKGLLMLSRTAHGWEEECAVARQANRLGVPAKVLTPREVAEIEPGIDLQVAGAVHYPGDCHLVPHRFVEALRDGVRERGGELLWETEVTGWERDGRRVQAVRTSRGRKAADEFVLCGGAWSGRVARELGLRLPMQAGKGYSLTLAKPRQLPSICSILTEARVAVTPMGGCLRVGGTMELGGLDDRVDPRRVRGIVRAVPAYYPAFTEADFDGIAPWHGLRPCSPDGLPYLGRSGRHDNLVVATGHAMMGLSLAPVTGSAVAAWVSGENPPGDYTLLAPDRHG